MDCFTAFEMAIPRLRTAAAVVLAAAHHLFYGYWLFLPIGLATVHRIRCEWTITGLNVDATRSDVEKSGRCVGNNDLNIVPNIRIHVRMFDFKLKGLACLEGRGRDCKFGSSESQSVRIANCVTTVLDLISLTITDDHVNHVVNRAVWISGPFGKGAPADDQIQVMIDRRWLYSRLVLVKKDLNWAGIAGFSMIPFKSGWQIPHVSVRRVEIKEVSRVRKIFC